MMKNDVVSILITLKNFLVPHSYNTNTKGLHSEKRLQISKRLQNPSNHQELCTRWNWKQQHQVPIPYEDKTPNKF